MNILTDMPIDTTNLAYIRFIETQKEFSDRISSLEQRIIISEKNDHLKKATDHAVNDKDKSVLYMITIVIALISFQAALLATIILSMIDKSVFLSDLKIHISGTNFVFDGRMFADLMILFICIGGLTTSFWILRVLLRGYFNYVPTSTVDNKDGSYSVLLEYKDKPIEFTDAPIEFSSDGGEPLR
jgi:hypothetical protein